MISPELDQVHQLLYVRRQRPPASLQDAREAYDRLCGRFLPPPQMTFEPANLQGVDALRGYEAGQSCTDRSVLYVHGGGFMVGSAEGFKGLAGTLAYGCASQVFAINYRLAPEYPYPAARDDVLQAYCALLEKGIAPAKIALAGDSAGAGLILAALIEAHARLMPMPSRALLLSPWVDLTLSGSSITTHATKDVFLVPEKLASSAVAYLGQAFDTQTANLILSVDLKGLPPLMIQVGSDEILFDDSLRLAARAGTDAVSTCLTIWPNMFHVFQAFAPDLAEGRAALKEASFFLQQHLS